ncbi:MAG: choice-of-anchor X domain-containing protein [Pseudomonadota bacterium]
MRATAQNLIVIGCVALLAGCGLEAPIFGAATDKGPDWVPDAPKPYKVKGQVYGLPGAAISYSTPGGTLLDQFGASADGDGLFQSEFPGSTEYRNLVVKAAAQPGSAVILGLALRIPRNPDIYYDQVASYHLGGMSAAAWSVAAPVAALPVFANLDDRSTTLTLALLTRAAVQEIGLTSVSIPSINQALQILADQYYGTDTAVHDAGRMISRLLAAAAANRQAPDLFLFPAEGSFLNPAFLEAVAVDYSGDGHPDGDTAAFDATLAAAAAAVTLSACEGTGRIKVVFMADMRPGSLDRNCNTINRFKVAKDEPGRRMYITGGMFTNPPAAATPACSGGVDDHCLSPEEWAEVNDMFGSWIPNQVPMRDDGEGGDAVADDGVWTIVLEVPFIPVESSPEGKGVRIGYKYTWGTAGAGWGGTEEWSGNNRILEITDRNGDGIIVRYDFFSDETSNKNVANLFKGPCNGTAPWPEAAPPGLRDRRLGEPHRHRRGLRRRRVPLRGDRGPGLQGERPAPDQGVGSGLHRRCGPRDPGGHQPDRRGQRRGLPGHGERHRAPPGSVPGREHRGRDLLLPHRGLPGRGPQPPGALRAALRDRRRRADDHLQSDPGGGLGLRDRQGHPDLPARGSLPLRAGRPRRGADPVPGDPRWAGLRRPRRAGEDRHPGGVDPRGVHRGAGRGAALLLRGRPLPRSAALVLLRAGSPGLPGGLGLLPRGR